jgi:predicted ATP-dependent serine protease
MDDKKQMYICKECGFGYEEKSWAEKCEQWCKEHHSCNLEITSHGKPPDQINKNNL